MPQQCSSCGGLCGGGFYKKVPNNKRKKYIYCKQKILSQIKQEKG